MLSQLKHLIAVVQRRLMATICMFEGIKIMMSIEDHSLGLLDQDEPGLKGASRGSNRMTRLINGWAFGIRFSASAQAIPFERELQELCSLAG